jgi:hypothetical protein
MNGFILDSSPLSLPEDTSALTSNLEKTPKKINNRQLLTKFRTSDHPLEIELGRYKKIVKLVKY